MSTRAGTAAIVASAVASVALVACYAALGGVSYEPAGVADPCAPREWREPSGIAESVEQLALSAADGVACSLGASREELILALRSSESLDAFAAENDLSEDEVEDAVREGVVRAVDDAEAADAIDGTLADVVRGAAERLPIGFVLDLIRGASGLIS